MFFNKNYFNSSNNFVADNISDEAHVDPRILKRMNIIRCDEKDVAHANDAGKYRQALKCLNWWIQL